MPCIKSGDQTGSVVQTILLRTEPHPPNATQTVTPHAVLNGDGADPLSNTALGEAIWA